MSSLYLPTRLAVPALSGYQQQINSSAITWLIVFILVVLVVWWLISRATKESPAQMESAHEEHLEHAEPEKLEPAALVAESESAPVDEPAEDIPPTPDNLADLEGIGPKVNKILQEAGITTFAQLAQADVDMLDELLDANGLHFMHPGSWPQQARLVVEGKTEELQALHEELKGGRAV